MSLLGKLVDDIRTTVVGMIIASLIGGTFVAGCIATYRAMAKLRFSWWFGIGSFVISGLAILVLILISTRRSKQASQQSTAQGVSTALLGAPDFSTETEEFFRLSYNSPLALEVEKRIRSVAAKYQAKEREDFYLHFIGIGVVGYVHDQTWAYIFRSQFLMLMELNRRILTLPEARTYYDKAVGENPTVYSNYSFDQWLSFLKTQLLILQNPDNTIVITERGQDFLRYSTHWGRYADDRKF